MWRSWKITAARSGHDAATASTTCATLNSTRTPSDRRDADPTGGSRGRGTAAAIGVRRRDLQVDQIPMNRRVDAVVAPVARVALAVVREQVAVGQHLRDLHRVLVRRRGVPGVAEH